MSSSSFNCSICMENKLFIAEQHNKNHPSICVDCFQKLIHCPFCRKRMKPDPRISLHQKKMTDFYMMM